MSFTKFEALVDTLGDDEDFWNFLAFVNNLAPANFV